MGAAHADLVSAQRVFDIVKPPPARWIDTRMKSGFGVMADDVIAGFYTVLALAAARAVIG